MSVTWPTNAQGQVINAPASATIRDSGVLVGSKVLIKMDTHVVGFAQSARCTDNYRFQPIHIMGQLQAIEYVPTNAMHEIVLTMMVMRNDSLIRHNLEPWGSGSYGYMADGNNIGGITGTDNTYSLAGSIAAGGDTGSVMNGNAAANNTSAAVAYSIKQTEGGFLTVLHNKVFTISITDAGSKKNLVSYQSCYYASGGFSISANNIVGHQVTFYALNKIGQMDAGDDSLGSDFSANG